MSSSMLKIIAALTMTLSHVYSLLFADLWYFYLIGRLAFPLYAWLVATGALHTRDIRNYLLRLFALAVISQAPYIAAHKLTNPTFSDLNVVFTLFAGLLSIVILNTRWSTIIKVAIIAYIAYLANVFHTDYGAVGVLSVVSFYLFRNSFGKLFLSQLTLIIAMIGYPAYEVWKAGEIHIHNMVYFGNILALFALPLIKRYNGQRGMNLKYFFYLYYPGHLIIIYFLGLWLM